MRVVVIGAALALIGVVGVIIYGYMAERAKWVGDADKTFWDYLELLIVPAAIGVTVLNWMQSERAREAEDAKEARERMAEDAKEAREREAQAVQWERELKVEDQKAQDEALQAYLDQISRLLTDKERPLRRARPGDNLSALARARTLTTLTRLDGRRKRSVLQFLYEADLVIKDHVVVDLKGADLRDAHLSAANLSAVNLSEAALSEADLGEADLSAATLHEASLTGADLLKADLSAANLGGADLREASLSGASLKSALGIANEKLWQQACTLEGATMPDGQKYEEWLKTSAEAAGRMGRTTAVRSTRRSGASGWLDWDTTKHVRKDCHARHTTHKHRVPG